MKTELCVSHGIVTDYVKVSQGATQAPNTCENKMGFKKKNRTRELHKKQVWKKTKTKETRQPWQAVITNNNPMKTKGDEDCTQKATAHRSNPGSSYFCSIESAMDMSYTRNHELATHQKCISDLSSQITELNWCQTCFPGEGEELKRCSCFAPDTVWAFALHWLRARRKGI